MSRSDAFVATVGTLLIENTSSLPWQAPLPPALAAAHGWYLPTAAGARCMFVLKADELEQEAVEAAIAAWVPWLEALHADESVLMVVWEDGAILDEVTFVLPEEGPWPVWLVDLATKSVARPVPPDDDQPFLILADTLISSYFGGTQMAPADLTEQEASRLEGRPPFSRVLSAQRSPGTWVLLGLISVIFVLTELAGGSTHMPVMWRAGVEFRPLVEQGEWWRLISANFLHFGWMHFAVNAYSLYALGPMLERLYGTRRFLAIYVVAGFLGSIASLLLNGGNSAGASGALFGLIGAMLLTGMRHQGVIPGHLRKEMRNLALIMLIINLGFGFSHPGIDNFAHLGGLVGGFGMAAMLGPNPVLSGRRSAAWTRWVLGVFPAIATLGLACSLVYWLSGRVPELVVHGAQGDYSAHVPIEQYGRARSGNVVLVAEDRHHWIEIQSRPNAFGKPPVTEATLDAHAARLGASLSEGARLVGRPEVVTFGRHRFVKLTTTTPDGPTVTTFVTASPRRLYLVLGFDVDAEPWMRPALNRVLETFDFPSP